MVDKDRLVELAEQMERHGVRLAKKADDGYSRVDLNAIAAAADCFVVPAALRSLSTPSMKDDGNE